MGPCRAEPAATTSGSGTCATFIATALRVNVGDDPFVTLFCYAADVGQNYGLIADVGGMAQLLVAVGNEGWTTRPNPDHLG
jgi:hypothetical protein